jgi:hypothetical protein
MTSEPEEKTSGDKSARRPQFSLFVARVRPITSTISARRSSVIILYACHGMLVVYEALSATC